MTEQAAPATSQDQIVISGMTKKSGVTAAVDNLDFRVRSSEFLVLLGHAGCGKTATLRSIPGLERPE